MENSLFFTILYTEREKWAPGEERVVRNMRQKMRHVESGVETKEKS